MSRGMRTALGSSYFENNRFSQYIFKNDTWELSLNNVVFDWGASISLGESVFKAFSGESFAAKTETHFIGGEMSREDWELFQCKRLGIEKFKGLLKLTNKRSGEVIRSCTLIGN